MVSRPGREADDSLPHNFAFYILQFVVDGSVIYLVQGEFQCRDVAETK